MADSFIALEQAIDPSSKGKGRVFLATDVTETDGRRMHLLRVSPGTSPVATGTLSNVGDAATSTTLLAANTARKGATIYNDSSATLYVKFGTTATTSSFTVALAGNGAGLGGYYEVPFGYTGIITGLWASDAGGNARITELT